MVEIYTELSKKRYDLAVVLPNSIRSGLIAFLSKAQIRIGYKRLGHFILLTDVLKRQIEGKKYLPIYMGKYYGALMNLIDLHIEKKHPKLFISKENDSKAYKIWDRKETDTNNILLVPGACFGASKLWPESHFASVIDEIGATKKAKFLISPGPGEDSIAEKIKSLAKYPVDIIPSSECDLSLLKAIIKHADILVSNDTGPRHMAHALATPSIILMGPTDPRHSENPGEKAVILRHDVTCAPCHLKICPKEEHLCMAGIHPKRVCEAIEKILSQKRKY